MDHPDDGRLLALLDGELPRDAAERVRRHLRGCAPCRSRRGELASAADTLSEAVGALDEPSPDVEAASVRSAAAEPGSAGPAPTVGDGPGGGRSRDPGPSLGRAAMWKAAVLVLTVGAAASAAVPGSPVRDWVVESARKVAGTFAGERPSAEPSASPASDQASPSGVSIRAEGSAEVAIDDPGSGLSLRVHTTGDTLLTVAGRGARYRAGESRIDVAGPEGPELRIDLPASVPVRVTVEGTLLLEQREDGRLTVHAPAADTTGEGLQVPVEPTGG